MIGTLLAAWSFIGRIPHVQTIAAFALCALASYAVGNYHATQRAVRQVAELVQAHADAEQAAVSRALIENQRKWKEKLDEAQLKAQLADNIAHDKLTEGATTARRAADAARLALANERKNADGLKSANEGLKGVNDILAREAMQPPAPGCVLSPRVREALDYASGASDNPAGRDPQAPTASGADGPTAASAVLTCGELADGYVALSEHDRFMRAWVLSFQAWASEAGR